MTGKKFCSLGRHSLPSTKMVTVAQVPDMVDDDDNKLVTAKDLVANAKDLVVGASAPVANVVVANMGATANIWDSTDKVDQLRKEIERLSRVRMSIPKYPETVILKA